MSLSDLASIGSLVSGVAVVASLIFVGFQVSQNTRALRQTGLNETNSRASSLRMALASDAELTEIWFAGLRDTRELSDTEQLRFQSYLSDMFWHAYSMRERTLTGLLKSGEYDGGLLYIGALLDTRRGKDWWANLRYMCPTDFAAEMDRAIVRQRAMNIAVPVGS